MDMSLTLVLAVNSLTLGGLLFLLSAGFSLIFGLMKIPNLTHGSFFMLGAYLATSLIAYGLDFWTAAVLGGLGVALFGGVVERFILRRLAGAELAQVLVTLGLSFMVADVCLMVWTGDPIRIATPAALRGAASFAGFAGVIGGPILSVYPGLDGEMLPLALVVVILGGSGSLLGSLVGSFVVGFLYNFGQAMFPELAYVVLFLPMLIVLVLRPQGLFGRPAV